MSKRPEEQFINREISWLSFNERVLQEAEDKSNPLIERIRFLGIFSNNLDEFFRVRVASLYRLSQLGKRITTGLDFEPIEVLVELRRNVLKLQKRYDQIFDRIEDELRHEGINFVDEETISDIHEEFVDDYFSGKVRPSLVPVIIGSKREFPELGDDNVYLAVRMTIEGDQAPQFKHAIIELPKHLPRFLVLPDIAGKQYVMFLEDVIRLRLGRIFSLFEPSKVEAYTIKITRDAQLDIDDDISKSLMEKMSKSLDKRKKGKYVRFVYDKAMPTEMLEFFMKKMNIKDQEETIPGQRYHNRKDLMSFPTFGRMDLCFKSLSPLKHRDLTGQNSLMNVIFKQDVLLHYPYQSFGYVVDLLREAAIDPAVRSIRINLYRVASNSQVINALINAGKNGKKVVVVIELQARFDEEHNIIVSEALQDAGVKVIFGVPGLKVHSKLILISKRFKGKTKRIAHIGTGNFHEKTAKIYTDLSLLTSDLGITNEVKKLFSFFENNYERPVFRNLMVSPYNNRRKIESLIQREIKNSKEGKTAWIQIKVNNLVDEKIIKKLYAASQAGVTIKLIVRGICSLIPGVEGMSENITVISIVDRFLEHARLLVFCNNEDPEYYITSADLMTRNLDHRVEVTVPIKDIKLKSELAQVFKIQHKDNQKARIIDKKQKNTYSTSSSTREAFNSQIELHKFYADKVENL